MTSSNRKLAIVVVLVALAALAGTALAQGAGPTILRWVLDSGGGPASGGEVAIVGSLGQPVVGLSSGPEVTLNAGYWTGLPTLQLSKSDGLDYWYAGWNYDYTMVISNTGEAMASGLVVTDTLPARVQIIALPAGAGRGPDGSIVWRPADLAPGSVLTLTLRVRTFSDVRGVITNIVQASCDGEPVVTAMDTTLIVAPPAATPSATPSVTPTATPTSEDLILTGFVYGEVGGSGSPRGRSSFAPGRRVVVAGARVMAMLCTLRNHEATSDSNGRYELAIPAVDADACAETTIRVSAEGYQPLYRTFQIGDLRAQPERDFVLTLSRGGLIHLPLVTR
ncbi:MAG: DUF11 domain-containing protein [Chloroflexi bacterium]|nr:DUF11 domain-containing protein [Chloroflexota bacterium]